MIDKVGRQRACISIAGTLRCVGSSAYSKLHKLPHNNTILRTYSYTELYRDDHGDNLVPSYFPSLQGQRVIGVTVGLSVKRP